MIAMPPDWVKVYCPVCDQELGEKEKGMIASFICLTEGCSQTKHFFYPDTLEPRKSIPWYTYHDDKKCHCEDCCGSKG